MDLHCIPMPLIRACPFCPNEDNDWKLVASGDGTRERPFSFVAYLHPTCGAVMPAAEWDPRTEEVYGRLGTWWEPTRYTGTRPLNYDKLCVELRNQFPDLASGVLNRPL